MAQEFDPKIIETAWDALIVNMQTSGKLVSEHAVDAQELAEGYRFLTRTVGGALDTLMEKNDPEHPVFTRALTPYRKYFGDNPDTYYDRLALDPSLTYKISGNRGSIPYLGFTIYGGGTRNLTIVSHLMAPEMVFSSNGDFEVYLSATRPKGAKNWLELDNSSRLMIVRQYFFDPLKKGAATYCAEVVGDVPVPAAAEPGQIAKKIKMVGRFLTFVTSKTVEFCGELEQKPNQLSVDSRNGESVLSFFPTHDNDYFIGWYDLKKDEALVVEGVPPECLYWSLTLYNRWFESYEYLHHQVHLNSEQITLNKDGSYRLVVSATEPENQNWLDTQGHDVGMLAFRWLGGGGVASQPTMRVVKMNDLN